MRLLASKVGEVKAVELPKTGERLVAMLCLKHEYFDAETKEYIDEESPAYIVLANGEMSEDKSGYVFYYTYGDNCDQEETIPFCGYMTDEWEDINFLDWGDHLICKFTATVIDYATIKVNFDINTVVAING